MGAGEAGAGRRCQRELTRKACVAVLIMLKCLNSFLFWVLVYERVDFGGSPVDVASCCVSCCLLVINSPFPALLLLWCSVLMFVADRGF